MRELHLEWVRSLNIDVDDPVRLQVPATKIHDAVWSDAALVHVRLCVWVCVWLP